jgi:hypothetical protein
MSYFGDAAFGEMSEIGSNSTITPTTSFTGTAEQNARPDVMVSCYSDDQDGVLYFDFSVNGTDWRTFPSSGFAVSAGIHEFHTAVKGPRYFRVRFTSTSSATTLQLYTYYGVFRQPSSPLNQAIGIDSDAIVTRPAIAQDYISLGLSGGVAQFNKFSNRPDLDTADGDALIIADSTTNNPTLLTTAETYTITYNSTTDGAGGSATGAINLYFFHLDENEEEVIEVHTLGSTGSDTTSFSGLGINRCSLGSSGSSGVNVNDITITHTTNTGVAGFIPGGQGTTQQAIFFTPSDSRAVAKSLFVNATKLSGGSSPTITFKGWVWNRAIETKFEIFRYIMDTSVENTMSFTDACNFPLSSGDVLWFTAETNTNNASVGAIRFSLNLYKNA